MPGGAERDAGRKIVAVRASTKRKKEKGRRGGRGRILSKEKRESKMPFDRSGLTSLRKRRKGQKRGGRPAITALGREKKGRLRKRRTHLLRKWEGIILTLEEEKKNL